MFILCIDYRFVNPDIGLGKDQEFGESAGAIYADTLGVLAEVSPPRQAVAAMAADDVAFAGDDVAFVEVMGVGAGGNDSADEFVADVHGNGDGFLGPGVPVVDVHIGSADAGPEDFDLHIVDAVFWNRHILEPETDFPLTFHQSAHRFHAINSAKSCDI